MRTFVQKNTLVAPAVSAKRERIASRARLDIPSYRPATGIGYHESTAIQAPDDGQAYPGHAQKPFLAPSEYTESSTTFSDSREVHLPNDHELIDSENEEQSEGVEEEEDDGMGVDGEFDAPHGDDGIASMRHQDDAVLSTMLEQIEYPLNHTTVYNHLAMDIETQSYPDTTSGRSTDAVADSRIESPNSLEAHLRNIVPQLTGSRSKQTDFPQVLHSEQSKQIAVVDGESSERLRLHAASYMQENVQDYYNSENQRQQARRVGQKRTNSSRFPILGTRAISPFSTARSELANEDNRPRSVAPLISRINHIEHSFRPLRQFQAQVNQQAAHIPEEALLMEQSSHLANPNEESDHDESLDYDPDVLYGMEYASLRAELFDRVPAPSTEDSGQEELSLEQKLERSMSRDAKEQGSLFESLTMEDWEKSGTWFATRFAQLTQRLQESRQERRKLAQQFEDEISTHYDAVIAEQQNVDETLRGIKSSGNMVLHQSTPKRR